jgi:hypothetical protein
MFVAALSSLVFALPAQIQELYLIEVDTVARALGANTGSAGEAIAAAKTMTVSVIGLLILSFLLWLGGLSLLADQPDRATSTTARLLAVAISVLPWLGVMLGLLSARAQADAIGGLQGIQLHAALSTYALAVAGLVVVVAAIFLLIAYRSERSATDVAQTFFGPKAAAVVCATIAAFTGSIVLLPTLPEFFGTVAVITLFLLGLAYLLTVSSHLFRCSGIPVTALVIIAAFCFSLLGLNDNHRVEYRLQDAPPPDLKESFAEWLESRADRQRFREAGKPYPVYIAAAEGGGLYASYHIASYLARLQDTCPNFAQHIFGISSVSGGSLGASVFASLASQFATNDAPRGCTTADPHAQFQSFTRDFFGTDFLSSTIAATLFPDMIQRALPMPITAFDRARTLEGTFASAWRKAAATHGAAPNTINPFEQSLSRLWAPSGATPALFLNTTGIETGSRVTLSSIGFDASPTSMHISRAMCLRRPRGIDLKLATAASLSARFPWVSPAGWLERTPEWSKECRRDVDTPFRGDRLYLADGGYFENSGLETALELRARLRAQVADVEIKIIVFFVKDDFANRWWSVDGDLSHTGRGELFTPLTTLLNTRYARARAVHSREGYTETLSERTDLYGVDGEEFQTPHDLHHVILDGTKTFLPLGWRLSRQTMRNIESSNGAFSKLTFDLIQLELNAEPIGARMIEAGALRR